MAARNPEHCRSSPSLPVPLQEAPGDTIHRSWHRCRGDGGRDIGDDPVVLPRGELSDRLDRHRRLLDAAGPEVDMLSAMVDHASSAVVLSDASGTILRSDGDLAFLRRAEQVALKPGVSWAEPDRGTNAIGTALIEAAPVRVHGDEHFLQCNRVLSCNAAPIWSARGELLGVLDISNDAGVLHAYALGLARLFARQIGNRLIEREAEGEQLIVLQRNAALLDTADRGLLVIRDGLVTGANDVALALLEARWDTLLGRPVRDWVEDGDLLDEQPMRTFTTRGRGLFALQRARSPTPARGDGRGPGGALRVRTGEPPDAGSRATVRPAPSSRPALPGRPLRQHAPLPALPPEVAPALAQAVRVLDAGMAVLVAGETGTGKEVAARHLHGASRWGRGPFVAVNCAALPESLVEAELFGYEPGTFTGARKGGARGLLREADGGLLLLDEIGDMPLALQARLLRVLQERMVQPLGATRPVPVDFGLVCASHQPLERRIDDGRFRADLYYRIQDFRLELPPLRTRPDLAAFIGRRFAREAGPDGPCLDPVALAALAAHPWPGNYRQLLSALRSLALLQPPDGRIGLAELPAAFRPPQAAASSGVPATADSTASLPAPMLANLRDEAIDEALRACDGRMSAAARRLGIHRSTLYRILARRAPGIFSRSGCSAP